MLGAPPRARGPMALRKGGKFILSIVVRATDSLARVTVRGARVDHAAGQPAQAFGAFRESAARGPVRPLHRWPRRGAGSRPARHASRGARFYAETHNESSTVCRPPVSLYDAFRAIGSEGLGPDLVSYDPVEVL